MKQVILSEDYLWVEIAKKLVWNIKVDRAGSHSQVFGKMQENLRDAHIVGIVDDDTVVTAPYSKLFTQKVAQEGCLQILRSEQHPLHSVIIVEPDSEGWLWEAAQEVGIEAHTFNLGRTLKELKTFTKGGQVHRNPNIPQFLAAINRANAPKFQNLHKWLLHEISRTL